jgi:hypothetical protein
MVVHVYNPNYLGGRGRRIKYEAGPGKSTRLYLKNKLKSKRTGGTAQEVERLPTKCESLSFFPHYCQQIMIEIPYILLSVFDGTFHKNYL